VAMSRPSLATTKSKTGSACWLRMRTSLPSDALMVQSRTRQSWPLMAKRLRPPVGAAAGNGTIFSTLFTTEAIAATAADTLEAAVATPPPPPAAAPPCPPDTSLGSCRECRSLPVCEHHTPIKPLAWPQSTSRPSAENATEYKVRILPAGIGTVKTVSQLLVSYTCSVLGQAMTKRRLSAEKAIARGLKPGNVSV
jgi:hypothetical protein